MGTACQAPWYAASALGEPGAAAAVLGAVLLEVDLVEPGHCIHTDTRVEDFLWAGKGVTVRVPPFS
jgi:hypothetical protein